MVWDFASDRLETRANASPLTDSVSAKVQSPLLRALSFLQGRARAYARDLLAPRKHHNHQQEHADDGNRTWIERHG